ncbi:HAD-IA family hydrolase [Anaerocolumna sedimenticola]|uniref:HAD-IA family hydrolase n=1 Tax=Anaerocolumna sedimenticola TaxID=2696063 RepID=A0A6P1TQ27_9FIRM|nr:HAD family phosphatase [Anaerocolumna sedimenticola]QHQ62319.1 HAD-IA family hydrolase [Anaerocolumna sedimenticola]
MITGAIFDLDGTILDSMSIWDKAGEMYLNSLGITAEPNLSKVMYSMSMKEGSEYLKNRYKLDLTYDAILDGINRTIEHFYYFQVLLKDGVTQFLDVLKKTGIKITLATSSDRKIIEKALIRLEVIYYFDRIFTCTEVGVSKEKPDIYLKAAEYMKTDIKSTWVFEDALYAIKTAKNAGFKTAGVFDDSSIADQNEIKSLSDIYLENLDNIALFLERADKTV